MAINNQGSQNRCGKRKDITDSYPTPFPTTFGGLAGKYPGVVDDDDVVGDDDDDNDDDDGSTVDR